jgi:hypothetical protein
VARLQESAYFFSPRGFHPTPYLRMLLSNELLRRMGFVEEAQKYRRSWMRIYNNPGSGNFPAVVLKTAVKAIYCVVDAVCYKPYSELGNKSLAQVFRFEQKD